MGETAIKSPLGYASKAGFSALQDPGGDALAHVTARHGALRRPPAIVRWGLLVWMAGCFYAAATKYPVADGRVKALAHLYYQAPAITLTAIWLWGANLWVWSRMRLDPHPLTVFELEDSRVHLGHRQVWTLCGWCTAAYAANLATFLHFANEGEEFIAAAAPVLLYVATPIVILAPHGGWHARTRRFFATTVRRALSPWSRPVSFADFFLADVACSLAKSFSDVERAVCSMVAGAVMAASDEDSACGSHSWRIPVALAAPSVVRLLQCLRQRADTGDETQTWNAIKYASAFPVIALSYAKYSVSHEAWEGLYRPAWIACAVANTAYSYYWDVKHDWDLRMFDRCGRVAGSNPDDASQVGEERRAHAGWLRQNLLYGDPGVYYFALATNFVLRASWTYKLSSHLRHNAGTVLFCTALEITRRFQWSLFRIEKAYLRKTGLGRLPR